MTKRKSFRLSEQSRKAKPAAVRSVRDYNPDFTPTLSQTADGDGLFVKPKPNGHITVNIDPEWLEDVTRTEVMNLVREALRK